MNTGTMEALEHASPVRGARRPNDPPSSQRHAMRELQPPWSLEDIEEPEAWTLASFDDLLPHEMA